MNYQHNVKLYCNHTLLTNCGNCDRTNVKLETFVVQYGRYRSVGMVVFVTVES